MKFSRTVFLSAAIAAATVAMAGSAQATNLVTNGSFETGYVSNTQFGAFFNPLLGPTGWSSPTSGLSFYYDAATATTVNATNQFSDPLAILYPTFPGTTPDGSHFVALDGDTDWNGPLEQTITGLIVGKTYNLSFYWAASQFQNRTGATTESLQVSLGGQTHSTAIVSNPSGGFTGWFEENFTYTATSTSELLAFLSVGSPNGLPPLALLDGVSLTQTPEPATWAMLIVGLLGVGGLVRLRRKPAPQSVAD